MDMKISKATTLLASSVVLAWTASSVAAILPALMRGGSRPVVALWSGFGALMAVGLLGLVLSGMICRDDIKQAKDLGTSKNKFILCHTLLPLSALTFTASLSFCMVGGVALTGGPNPLALGRTACIIAVGLSSVLALVSIAGLCGVLEHGERCKQEISKNMGAVSVFSSLPLSLPIVIGGAKVAAKMGLAR